MYYIGNVVWHIYMKVVYGSRLGASVGGLWLYERRKEMFYLTFYLRLYGVGHMVKDHSDTESGNPLPPHGLLFSISSKGSFICIIPQTG